MQSYFKFNILTDVHICSLSKSVICNKQLVNYLIFENLAATICDGEKYSVFLFWSFNKKNQDLFETCLLADFDMC